jgi:hypothetical protein
MIGAQALEYRINLEIYTPYADAVGMLLPINGKFKMGSNPFDRKAIAFKQIMMSTVKSYS